MLSYTSDRKKVSLLLRSTGTLSWLDFTAKLSCQIFEFLYVTNQGTVQAI